MSAEIFKIDICDANPPQPSAYISNTTILYCERSSCAIAIVVIISNYTIQDDKHQDLLCIIRR